MKLKLIAAGAAALAIVSTAFTIGRVTAPHNPVCIVVHSNGAPAPANCNDLSSYQVGDR